MINVLKNRTYATLFAAQVIALIGTGLLTIALALLAFDIAGETAGAVLGTAYAIKMIAYVGLSPLANTIVDRLPRKTVLIAADIIRASVALFLPFIDSVWQIYVLIFVLQAASATFTPTFQAIIPDILEDEAEYTKALSLSRLAYDLENLISPALAGVLLIFVTYNWLFVGTVAGFIGSAVLVYFAAIPALGRRSNSRPFFVRLTRGTRIYLATPRLRGLLAVNMSAAAVGAFVLVNTVVLVRVGYRAEQAHVAYALAAFGAGSMLAAIVLPRLLEAVSDRRVMISSALVLALLTLCHAIFMFVSGLLAWPVFLIVWGVSGVLYASILTPSGRLLRKSAHAEDRPAVFAAQFSLSHACWLLTYPLAGWVGEVYGLPVAMALLGAVALAGFAVALLVWPIDEPGELTHEHPDLPVNHAHFQNHRGQGHRHSHVFVIDDEHRSWPTHG
ncbi:MAG: MFS transporter [Paracoccaceae bacterium]